jgi:hypothetical protein
MAASACAWDKRGQRRVGPTSARTIRVHRTPPFVRGARARQHYNTSQEERPLRWQECVPASEEVTSLVRALALHGVAMLRSHLASTLRPGRGVLIRSVSRRLGSVACVREDASPNEVSNELSSSCCPSLVTRKRGSGGRGFGLDELKDARFSSRMSNRAASVLIPPRPVHRPVIASFDERNKTRIRLVAIKQLSARIFACPATCLVTEETHCPPHRPHRSPTQPRRE